MKPATIAVKLRPIAEPRGSAPEGTEPIHNEHRPRAVYHDFASGMHGPQVTAPGGRCVGPDEAGWESGLPPLPAEQSKHSLTAYKRVLIADDDASVRDSLAAVLESEGYVADQARNGMEAVARAVAYEPDLVLLDLNMPQWDGWTAFHQMDRVNPLLPVIVITARPNQYAKAIGLGVDAFMEKPLNIPVLLRAIQRLTNEEKARHLRRITDPGFVTELLGSAPS